MENAAIYELIRKTVQSFLPDSRILLFGSHARGTADEHSDYDLLIITPNPLTRSEKLSWSKQVHKAIVKAIHSPIDLLLYSEEDVANNKELPGHIVRTALRDGVAL